MRVGTLVRTSSGEAGTFGLLVFDQMSFHTAELPWKDNAVGESCIPPGWYDVVWNPVGVHKGYEIPAVPGRTNIEIHVGNWAGDKRRGLRTDTDGCILLGLDRRTILEQAAIGRSEKAIKELHALMAEEPWRLLIVKGY